MTRIDLHRGLKLARQDEAVGPLYFLEDGIASVVAVDGKSRTETGIIGKEGAVGVPALLGQRVSRLESFIQVDGKWALRIDLEDMRAAFRESDGIRNVMLPFAHCFMVQVAYAVVSSAQDVMEARLARWLLMCHDRVAGDQIASAYEFKAQMISASAAASP